MSYSSDNAGLQNQLPISIEISREPGELREEVNDIYQSVVSSVNSKIGGLYVPQEKVNSEQYFDKNNPQRFKNVYRMVVDFGALPNTTSKSVEHNIPGWNSEFKLTSAWGGATDPTAKTALPIPNDGITLLINEADVIITTTSNLSSYTFCTVVVEYTKN
jgi:hypothetical protein